MQNQAKIDAKATYNNKRNEREIGVKETERRYESNARKAKGKNLGEKISRLA